MVKAWMSSKQLPSNHPKKIWKLLGCEFHQVFFNDVLCIVCLFAIAYIGGGSSPSGSRCGDCARRARWGRCLIRHEKLGVSENSVPLNPMVLLIIIPIKWLEYTLFSDKPNWCSFFEVNKQWFFVWVKRGHFCQPWLGMVTYGNHIPPINMVMTGGWFKFCFTVLPILLVLRWHYYLGGLTTIHHYGSLSTGIVLTSDLRPTKTWCSREKGVKCGELDLVLGGLNQALILLSQFFTCFLMYIKNHINRKMILSSLILIWFMIMYMFLFKFPFVFYLIFVSIMFFHIPPWHAQNNGHGSPCGSFRRNGDPAVPFCEFEAAERSRKCGGQWPVNVG